MAKKCLCCNKEIEGPYLELTNFYYGRRYICMDNCGTYLIGDYIDTSNHNAINVIIYHSGVDNE